MNVEASTEFLMNIPIKLLFGAGKLNELHKYAKLGKKAMIVTSGGSIIRNGFLDRVKEQLCMAGVDYTVFDKVRANPTKQICEEGGRLAKAENVDFIVSIGGGSSIDAAKAIAALATNNVDDLWYYVRGATGLGNPIENDPLPTIAIPTTAGTGSEMDGGAVITKPETNEKSGLNHPMLNATVAIVDPELMLSVPPKFTAFQGFDALFHSTEAYISNDASLMSDTFALSAIEHCGKYLVTAVNNGSDLEARSHIAYASSLSGMVMTMCMTTAKHSLEHAMSGFHNTLPHGAGLLMIAKAFYTFLIEKHICDERFITMAQALGMKSASDPHDFVRVLEGMMEACGVNDLKMSDYGITPEEFVPMTKNAKTVMGSLFKSTPYALSDEDCVEIFAKSYR